MSAGDEPLARTNHPHHREPAVQQRLLVLVVHLGKGDGAGRAQHAACYGAPQLCLEEEHVGDDEDEEVDCDKEKIVGVVLWLQMAPFTLNLISILVSQRTFLNILQYKTMKLLGFIILTRTSNSGGSG